MVGARRRQEQEEAGGHLRPQERRQGVGAHLLQRAALRAEDGVHLQLVQEAVAAGALQRLSLLAGAWAERV